MRYLIPFLLCFLLFGCVETTKEDRIQFFLANSLDSSALNAFRKGEALLLYAYNVKSTDTEAYADWAAYLNDFKEKANSNSKFYFFRVQAGALNSAFPSLANVSEFSLFLKKGMPTYLYKDLIVEPQVYTAVEHVYYQVPLTEEDKAFLPDAINFP